MFFFIGAFVSLGRYVIAAPFIAHSVVFFLKQGVKSISTMQVSVSAASYTWWLIMIEVPSFKPEFDELISVQRQVEP